jgi:hypothetical protein
MLEKGLKTLIIFKGLNNMNVDDILNNIHDKLTNEFRKLIPKAPI